MSVDSVEWWQPRDTFGDRLALVRKHMRWNMAEAARACGTNHQSWRNWELEDKQPSRLMEMVQNIAAASGADPDWLLWGQSRRSGGPLPPRPGGMRDPGGSMQRYFLPTSPPVAA